MENKNRKYPRLTDYQYSLPGYYYVTIHNAQNAPQLSAIIPGDAGQRAAVKLTRVGRILMEQLLLLEQRYAFVKNDKYVIMPTHIHVIIRLLDGEMPRAALTDIIGAYKSLSPREINRVWNTPGRKQFQRSFYETVIRNETAYQSCWKYIDENPDKWGMREETPWFFRTVDKEAAAKRLQIKR